MGSDESGMLKLVVEKFSSSSAAAQYPSWSWFNKLFPTPETTGQTDLFYWLPAYAPFPTVAVVFILIVGCSGRWLYKRSRGRNAANNKPMKALASLC